MAVAVSYPGVYVQAIIQPSPPDSGVATSLAAFVGRMAMGPVNTPTLLNSWGDYQRFFGGLSELSSPSYQVSAFFNNGGGQALGVRLFEPTASDADIGQQIAGLVGAAKTAADALYSADTVSGGNANDSVAGGNANDSVAGGNANDTVAGGNGNDSVTPSGPTSAAVIAAVTASFNTAIMAGGVKGQAANLLNLQWVSDSMALAATPAQADVDKMVDGLINGVYTFTSTISINPLNPINAAVQDLVETLQLEVGAGASMEQVNLVVAGLASDYASQPLAASALTYLTPKISSASSVAAIPAAVYAAIPAAYQQAIPVLSQTSDPTYGGVATDMADVITVMTALAGGVGTVYTAQTALAAAAAPGATAAAVTTAVTNFQTANYPTDNGAKGVVTAVSGSSATLATQVTAATAAVTALYAAVLPAKNANKWATAAVTSFTTAPTGDLMGALADAEMGGLAAEWPADADLQLTTVSPGSWGNSVTVTVDTNGISSVVAQALNVTNVSDLFNLTVTYVDSSGLANTESFSNVTLNPAYPQLLLANVLADQSNYVGYLSGDAFMAGASGTGAGGQDSLPLTMTTYLGNQNAKTGIYALEKTPIFNILCIPPDDFTGDTPNLVCQTAAEYCNDRYAMLIVDPPTHWYDLYLQGNLSAVNLESDLGNYTADAARSSAVYFPRVLAADPLRNGQMRLLPNCGYMAGIWAATDTQVGVWKAPAGLDAAIGGIAGLQANLSNSENGLLNPIGVNCLRTFPIGGSVVWGARTLRGADQLGDQYNYVPVRRLLLYIEDWVLQNTKWAVFQPNDESLWSGLRTQLSTMLNGLWKQGALFGASASQAYFVNCDATTTTQADIDAGKVNVQIGFAPVKPAEFVIVTLQQIAGQSS